MAKVKGQGSTERREKQAEKQKLKSLAKEVNLPYPPWLVAAGSIVAVFVVIYFVFFIISFVTPAGTPKESQKQPKLVSYSSLEDKSDRNSRQKAKKQTKIGFFFLIFLISDLFPHLQSDEQISQYLTHEIITPGDGKTFPQAGNKVTVHYVGTVS